MTNTGENTKHSTHRHEVVEAMLKSLANPQYVAARHAFQQGNRERADQLAKNMIELDANNVLALTLRGEIELSKGWPLRAKTWFERSLAIAPDYLATVVGMATVFSSEGRLGEAGELIDRALAIDPVAIRARILKAALLERTGGHEASILIAQGVLLELPNHVPTLIHLGNNYRILGQIEQAISALREAIGFDPANGHAWVALADLKTYALTDAELAQLADCVVRPDLPDHPRAQLSFALGKALLDRGEIEAAFTQFEQGNALFRKLSPHDPDHQQAVMLDWVERSIALPAQAADQASRPEPPFRPVFILGLPRSGTTLLEQMLTRHSQIEATDELPYIPMLTQPFVDGVGVLGEADLPALTETYRASVQLHRRTDKRFVLDKRLENFWNAAFIKAVLPEALFIDVRRHPLASIVSIFQQSFTPQAIGYSGTLEELARLRRSYVEAMSRFENAFRDRLIRVRYEDLIDDAESEVRRVLDFLGLPFEPVCLEWYASGQPVRTPSAQQVRQPIFRNKLEEWRRFERYLGPAKEVLKEELANYPG